MNIANLLHKTAIQHPDLAAISSGKQLYCNYQTLSRRTASIAHQLIHSLGMRPGDRIALAMKNCPEYLEVLLAILHAGMVAVPINAKLHTKEFAYIIQNSKARLAFSNSPLTQQLEPLVEELPSLERIIDVGQELYSKMLVAEPMSCFECQPDDLAWLFYTSGTTGKPKGAMLSHRNLMTMTLSYFASVDQIQPGDTLLHAAPLSHGSGMYAFPHFAKGGQQVITESGSFEPDEIYGLIAEYPGVSMFAAPTMIKRLTDTPPANGQTTEQLKSIIYGGGPMYVADIKEAINSFGNKFIQIYGQGESPMTITSLSKLDHIQSTGDHDKKLASVGTAQIAVELQIVDGTGAPLPAGEIGEIAAKGDSVMNGYWNNPKATEETIINGWLHTGDMGVIDEQGYLTLKDRSKDLIISGGTNIYPREVEEVLLTHPEIEEVSVIGQLHPEWGEEVTAFIVRSEPQQLTASAVDQFCLDNMARFKRPKTYFFVTSLPKNNYGKVLKTELREQAETLANGQRV